MQEPYDVLVSFSASDRPRVEGLIAASARKGLRMFYDVWHDSAPVDEALLREIYDDEFRHAVFFVSAAYLATAWATAGFRAMQVRRALERPAHVTVVRLDDAVIAGLPASVSVIDARGGDAASVGHDIAAVLIARRGAERIATELGSPVEEHRLRALTKVAIRGLDEHLDAVIELMLEDASDMVRQRAAWALDNINDAKAAPALLQAIYDPVWEVRSAAGWALVHLGDCIRKNVELIIEHTKDPNAREIATLVLDRLR